MALFSVRDLTKIYRRRKVVQGINFHVEAGEIVGLLGPNGAGKTTTFKMAIGRLRPDAGEVELDGHTVTKMPMYQRARLGMGYLAQEPSIFRSLSVVQNLQVIAETLDLSKAEQRARMDKLLKALEIEHLRKSRAEVLSGGERRRLEIARALMTEPRLLLLDEPFAGVDPIAVADIQSIVRELREEQGISILLTDHNVRETLAITDRAYIIVEGKVIKEGPKEDLVDDEIVRRLYLGEDFRL